MIEIEDMRHVCRWRSGPTIDCMVGEDSHGLDFKHEQAWTTSCKQLLTITPGLCQRRHWPEPLFQTYRTRYGYGCTVRVNNREYSTDVEYETDELAKNAAATRAYMICRNFSVNDGMYPGQRPGQGGVVQGLPVAIGTGRRSTVSSNDYDSGSSSGGNSPRGSDCGLAQEPHPSSARKASKSPPSVSSCYCGRGTVRAYERCTLCLRAAGYAV